jgi:hypothetical protein
MTVMSVRLKRESIQSVTRHSIGPFVGIARKRLPQRYLREQGDRQDLRQSVERTEQLVGSPTVSRMLRSPPESKSLRKSVR